MSRTLVHVGGDDGLLEAAARIRQAGGEGDLVLVMPEGAPALANPFFLTTLRGERPDRALVLVTADERARAMASGRRIPAYASVAAYEERAVDPTEQLEVARLAALRAIARDRRRRRSFRWRRTLVWVVATLVAAIVLLPSAEVVVALESAPIAPIDVQVITAPVGSIAASPLSASVTAKASGTATGLRTERTRATGVERFTNASTEPVTVPQGTIVSTSGNVQFRTTQARTVGPSSFFPFFVSEVQIPIEAVQPGPAGNVPKGAITNLDDRRLRVTNDVATGGGEEKRVPVVQQSDYVAALGRLDESLAAAAREQVARWRSGPPAGMRVDEAFATKALSRPSADDVVGKEVASFELQGAVQVSAYAVPTDEPRATALAALRAGVRDGYELVPDSVAVEVGSEVDGDGLRWRVKARGTQRPRLDEGALRIALLGRDRASAAPLLAERGFRLVSINSFPSWWPRLPLLPVRIVATAQR